LLPGTAFAFAVRLFLFDQKNLPTLSELAVLALAGYFSALLTQPIASRIVGWIEDWAERKMAGDLLYIRKVQEQLGSSSRRAMILSKMHGEVTFFVQLGVLSLLFLAVNALSAAGYAPCPWWALLIFVVAAGDAVDVAFRRVKRARNERSVLIELPVSTAAIPTQPGGSAASNASSATIVTTTTT